MTEVIDFKTKKLSKQKETKTKVIDAKFDAGL